MPKRYYLLTTEQIAVINKLLLDELTLLEAVVKDIHTDINNGTMTVGTKTSMQRRDDCVSQSIKLEEQRKLLIGGLLAINTDDEGNKI